MRTAVRRVGEVMGGAGLTALDTGHEHVAPSRVPVQIFDLDGGLLAEAAARTTREAAAPGDADAPGLIQQGPEFPGFGPTSVPSLARLGATRVSKHVRPPGEAAGCGERLADAPGGPAQSTHDDTPSGSAVSTLDDTPSGSALSTLDAIALFGDVARRQFARG